MALDIDSIDQMKKSGALDTDSYHKCLVELAYRFFKDGDNDNFVLSLSKCNPNYFKSKCMKHMEEDEVYKDIVIYISYKLMQCGMIEADLAQPNVKNPGVA